MLYLLFGPNRFEIKLALQTLQHALSLPVDVFNQLPEKFDPTQIAEVGLFGKPQVYVFDSLIKELDLSKYQETWSKSANHFILLENSLDKRLTETKKILESKLIKTQEFVLPEGVQVYAWVENYVKNKNGKITKILARELVLRLYPDLESTQHTFSKVQVDLYRLANEIDKLLLFDDKEVTQAALDSLVVKNLETEAFSITNAVGEKQKLKTFQLLENFYSQSDSGDEKSKTILLCSILAEQFRNLWLAKSSVSLSESEILQATGWKSGRLFVMKKLARKFTEKQIKDVMVKLEALDKELKTTDTPPRVILELILVSLLV